MMKKLIDAIINKWFCCHEWEFQYKETRRLDPWTSYEIRHYFCKKCGKYKSI